MELFFLKIAIESRVDSSPKPTPVKKIASLARTRWYSEVDADLEAQIPVRHGQAVRSTVANAASRRFW